MKHDRRRARGPDCRLPCPVRALRVRRTVRDRGAGAARSPIRRPAPPPHRVAHFAAHTAHTTPAGTNKHELRVLVRVSARHDDGAADPWGDGCAEYTTYPSWCGNFDDNDFTSNDMCCICGGGAEAAAHLPEGFTCLVHSGFRESYEGLVNVGLVAELEALLDDITAAGGSPKVLVAGHSLGGAMATVAA